MIPANKRVYHSLLLLLTSVLLLLTACDSAPLGLSPGQAGDTESADAVFAIAQLDEVPLLSLEPGELVGASGTGAHARMVIKYKTNLPQHWFTKSNIELHLRLQPLKGPAQSADQKKYRSASFDVPAGLAEGRVVLSVPADIIDFEIVGQLYQPRTQKFLHTARVAEILDISLVADPAATLNPGSDVYPYVVPGSYVREPAGQRTLHRFTVQVFDRDPDDDNRVSIAGLADDPSGFFKAYENGDFDVESPVTVDSRRELVPVYFVLDASYSIVEADATDDLTSAAARSVLALRQLASFDYRQFSGYIRGLDEIDDIRFDNEVSSTAFYYALDDTLGDIEQYSSPYDHKIVIAFTDGRDYASQGKYPDINSDSGMLDYITRRIRSVRKTQYENGGGLDLHIVSVGNADETALLELAAAGGGVYANAESWSGVGQAFDDVSRRILSTYFLQYNSQRTDVPGLLELEVSVNGSTGRVTVD